MVRAAQIAIIAALISAALSGCTQDEPEPIDTSTDYMFDNIFNPCRQMPQKFLDEHLLKKEPKGINNLIEGYLSLGCSYAGPEYDFSIALSNAPLREVGQFEDHTLQPTRIAGRAAKIQNRPLEHVRCVLYAEMTGGVLALYLTINVVLDVCTTLTALAEELIPLLPQGA
ncbi:hypothetical protein [Nocardia sp. R6R-6]|uniref:hypothetical protein n=1 Tax=Nocardia sp. R6R-6 TaxID=3459303 RepID=UPI00403E2F1C